MKAAISRRSFVQLVLAGLAPVSFGLRAAAQPSDFDPDTLLVPTEGISGRWEPLVDLARQISTEEAQLPEPQLSGIFEGLDYDAYRAIRPAGLPLQRDDDSILMDPLPPGSVFSHPVSLSLIHGEQTFDLRFDPSIFEFGADYFTPESVAQAKDQDGDEGLGYSGFRLRAALNRPDKLDEFIVFQGASYFRAVARGLIYGLSARGLAIDTAAQDGEEFPLFTKFWIEAPEPKSHAVIVRALLDSRSCAGAFEFEISPGETTVIQTRCRLFPRREIDQIGVAPLTSMFFFGPSKRAGIDDYRDAVHDSSGLQIVTGTGRRIWRSLGNPPTLQVSAFTDENPQGFGLSQRQSSFDFYQDAEARYEKRPSCWIEPLDPWGRGSVVLIEIPVRTEFHDNIVAFWRPEAPLGPSDEGHEFQYRLHWSAVSPDTMQLGRVYAHRSGASINDPDQRVVVVDFRNDEAWPDGLQVDARANGSPVDTATLVHLPDGEGLRVAFNYEPGDTDTTELEITLMGPDGPASETWLYRLIRP